MIGDQLGDLGRWGFGEMGIWGDGEISAKFPTPPLPQHLTPNTPLPHHLLTLGGRSPRHR
ncbi:hypothetical protein EZJ55_14235 [Microcystis aeruginosa EAWAG127a]|uniref:Uncharacterized protein n=1 Tax=Microcystis aeruginosa EAWAG127a TaxID=2529855 RepID=A0A5J5LUX4_MICAE|nr:hypothetical protein EZJ55_14235 [Microcystis aeruginosa EAWAG127a]